MNEKDFRLLNTLNNKKFHVICNVLYEILFILLVFMADTWKGRAIVFVWLFVLGVLQHAIISGKLRKLEIELKIYDSIFQELMQTDKKDIPVCK